MDLPTIAEVFAESFDDLPAMFDGRTDYRYLVSTGSLVAAAVVVGQLVADGTIVLVGIDIDLGQRRD